MLRSATGGFVGRVTRALSLVLASLAVACAGTTYGTRKHEVSIATAPAGAQLYLVRATEWEVGKGPELLDAYLGAADAATSDAARAELLRHLARYRIDLGPTPVTLALVAHQHLAVAVKGAALGRGHVMPRPSDDDDLMLQLVEPSFASSP